MATSTVEQKVVMNEFHKMTKQYRKAFDNVLQGHYEDAIPILKEYLSYLDNNVKRPIRDYNDCQEALKQCWSALANAFSKSITSTSGRKDSSKENNSAAWRFLQKLWYFDDAYYYINYVLFSLFWSVHKF